MRVGHCLVGLHLELVGGRPLELMDRKEPLGPYPCSRCRSLRPARFVFKLGIPSSWSASMATSVQPPGTETLSNARPLRSHSSAALSRLALPRLRVATSICPQLLKPSPSPTRTRPRRRRSSPPSTTSQNARAARRSLGSPLDPARWERRTCPQARSPRPSQNLPHPAARPTRAVVPRRSSSVGPLPASLGSRWEATLPRPSTRTFSLIRTPCPLSTHISHTHNRRRLRTPSGRRKTGRL